MSFWVSVMAWGRPASGALWAWAAALAVYAFSNVLYGLREHLPPPLMVLLGNAANMGALALMLLAVRRFQGVPLHPWLGLMPVLLMPVLLSLLVDQPRVRTVIGASVYLAQIALILHALFDRRHPLEGRGRYMVLTAFAGLGLIL